MTETELEQAAKELYEAFHNQGPNPWKLWEYEIPPFETLKMERNSHGGKTPVELKWLAVAKKAQEMFAKPGMPDGTYISTALLDAHKPGASGTKK